MSTSYWIAAAILLGVVLILMVVSNLGSLSRRVDALEQKSRLAAEHAGESLNEWQKLALESRKIDAIRVYRQETGAGLAEAKDAVEAWMRSR
jgi:ribosomal protein L7/L12